MKPLYMKDILNYEYPVTALNALTSQNCTADGFYPEDLVRDFYGWRSNTTDQIDIYFEISESDSLSTFVLLGTNLSSKAQVYISASNTSGVGGFASPLYTKSLVKKNQNWIFHTDETLTAAQYYKITIFENDITEKTFIEITRILAGNTEEFPVDLVDGFLNGSESFQKRETQKGQWRPGSENSMLKVLQLEFAPIYGNRGMKNHDYSKIYDMNVFLEDVKTSKPFLFILNPEKPEQLFEYVIIDGDSVEISYEDNGTTIYSLNLKELK